MASLWMAVYAIEAAFFFAALAIHFLTRNRWSDAAAGSTGRVIGAKLQQEINGNTSPASSPLAAAVLVHETEEWSSSLHSVLAGSGYEFDVFLSFRGKDVRQTFTDYLYHSLIDVGVHTFRDNEELHVGKEIGPDLMRAIEQSRISMPIFSRSYASSKWCLREVTHMVKCMKEIGDEHRLIVPIFLDVTPDEVQHQTGAYAESFARHERKYGSKNVKEWRDALKEAMKLKGLELSKAANGNQGEFIKLVVATVLRELRLARLDVGENLVGLDDPARVLMQQLEVDNKDDIRMVGIWGIQGIGKTTLAKYVYKQIADDFECCSFLHNIRETSVKPGGLLELQSKLASDILGQRKYDLAKQQGQLNFQKSYDELYRLFRANDAYKKKILIVLDDVSDKDQVALLGVSGRRGPLGRKGSRILITTEHEQLLDDIEVHCKYLVSALSSKDSLRLFSREAFGEDEPEKGYEELSENLVHYTGGLPLAVHTLGACLSGRTEDRWGMLLEKLVQSPSLDWVEAYSENVDLFLLPYLSVVKPYQDPVKTIGRFGCTEGKPWDDGKHSNVRQINVVYNSVVQYISFIYDDYGHPTTPLEHGEQGSGQIHPVKLDYPNEYLTSISGYLREDHGKLILQSLSFHSNTTKHGPFGKEIGFPFSSPSTGGMIVGFYGSVSSHLESIGAYLEPVSHIHPVRSVGPFGGYDGRDTWADGNHTSLRKILIRSGAVINRIICIYDNDGAPVETPSRGDDRGGNHHTVELDSDEYITSISGFFGYRSYARTVIASLKFQSNKRVHGPYGQETGTYFQSPPIGKLIGFYGRSGPYLHSIGAYFAPDFHIDPIKTIGPYGGRGGNPWDEGRHTNLRKIVLSYGSIIDGIGFAYDESRESEPVLMHGGRGGLSFTIELKPSEYLISVSGYTGIRNETVGSLMFRSNERTFGPFGRQRETPFSFTSSIGKIVGFFGRSGRYLDSIGAYIELLRPDS